MDNGTENNEFLRANVLTSSLYIVSMISWTRLFLQVVFNAQALARSIARVWGLVKIKAV